MSTTPGVAGTTTITITNVGNVDENNVTLASTTPDGLTLTGLGTVSLPVGQSVTQTVTLTPDAAIPLNSSLSATIKASFGTPTVSAPKLVILLGVVVPGADAIANASVAAQQLSNPGLANRFNDLSIALTNLVQGPTDPVAKSQALANLDSLISQLTTDPFLSGFTGGLTTARSEISAATTAATVQAAVTKLGQALDILASVITDVAQHQLALGLSPDRQIVQPNAPQVFSIPITNNGTVATTYNLSVSGLPADVSSQFSQTSVTLQPGQSLIAGNNAPTLTLIESGDTLVPVSFVVIAAAVGAPEITRSVAGLLTLRTESIVVTGIVTNPPFANAGSQVNVSAKVLGTVNGPTQISASFVAFDSSANTLFTSAPTLVSLTGTSGLLTVDLGSLDTTGFVNGVDTITVTLSSGGSAQTTLLIGQPVSANLTTTPAILPTGSDTVTNTMSVTTQASFPAPLTLLGAATTPAPGTSVAVYQSGASTYAYESGTGGIDAFDVTDPANPQFLKVFGQGDIVNGQFGFNIARIVSGKLVIATTTTLNASGFNLLVYDLTDPTNPQFVSNTVINHRFLADLLVNSNATAAFVPTNGVSFFGNRIASNFGDFSAIDLSDPAHPVLGSTLFNNQGSLNGGDMNQFGGTLINDQVAYSAGLAPGGNTVIGNHGNLLAVDVTHVTNISLITQLAIPGTINIIDVAASGDRALVIGTAGIETGTIDFNVKGFANNLTLTLLDITDSRHPLILGSTFVTSQQFPLNEAGAKTDVVALGNGQFAVSDTGANGLPALLVIDPSDPSNMIVGVTQVPSGAHGITVAGDLLYASTSNGLSIYHIEPLVSSPVTITVSLPPGSVANILPNSFNIAPSQTSTSDTGDSLVWHRSFASGNTNYTFTWQTKISGITAGQSFPVTSGASISFVDQGTPGSLTLPGTLVTGVSIISVSPGSQTQQPGGSSTYNVRLSNPTGAAVTYNLSTTQSNSVGQIDVPFSVMVPANGSVDVPLTFTSFISSQPGDDTITVTTDYVLFASNFQTQLGEFKGSATTSVTIAGAPVIQPDDVAHGVVAQLTPTVVTVGQGGDARYVVRLTNTGSETDFYSLETSGLPAGAFASFDGSLVEVPPGESNFRELTLIIHTFGVGPASYPFTVTATTSSKSSVTSAAEGTLRVVSNGVSVSLSPASGNPGSSFNLTVRNTGTVADTFDLALGGPAALVSSLGVGQVTLGPGASQQVPITTTSVRFSLPGTLGLAAVATSVTETNVRSMADANLNIVATLGMTAAFDPASKALPAPGDATFRLAVQNTGNVEDSYQAVITGTTGPITAFLVGLDGTPAQSIPVFRLPALAAGAISLKISAQAGGLGSATVQIRSLTDGSIVSTSTATLSAATSVQTAPRVLQVERFGYHARPTTLVITFDRALDAASAANPANYILKGPKGRIRLARVTYDPTTLSVTLHPVRRLPLKYTYHLVIRGTGHSYLRGTTGTALDGRGTGESGGDYVTRINRDALVIRHPSGLVSAKSHATRLLHHASVPHGPRHLKTAGAPRR